MVNKRSIIGLLLYVLSHAIVYGQAPVTVINGARFEIRYPLSPGAYAQAYGDFAGVPATFAPPTPPLPTQLAGVQVLVDEIAAPLYAVGPEVMSFVVPQGTLPGRAAIRITSGGDTIGEGVADILAISPGIFFVLGDPLAQGGVLNQQNQYAVPGAPAQRGQAIQIFGTGQGPVDVNVPDGDVPDGVLANAVGETKVFVSGYEAEVIFSGLSPQFPGVWQVNATIPNEPFLSGLVALVVTVDGVPSNQVSFWVAE